MARKPRPVRGLSASVSDGVRVMSGLYRSISEPQPPSGRTLLTQSDFTYLGALRLPRSAGFGDTFYPRGFTHRYVGETLEFLTLSLSSGGPVSYSLAGFTGTFGSPGDATVRVAYGDCYSTALGDVGGSRWWGIYWDDVAERLYWAWTTEYDGPYDVPCIGYATLSSSAVTGQAGMWQCEDWHSRRNCGGWVAVPQWFQTQYGVDRLAGGFGGYYSIVGEGCSLGLALRTMPAIDTGLVAAGGTLPTSSTTKTLVNFSPATNDDWWTVSGATSPSTFDRGRRLDVLDYTSDYTTTGHWNPYQGTGSIIWGDGFHGACVWIDGPSKHGLVAIPTLGTGRNWYQDSQLQGEEHTCEMQVFDPTHLGEAAAGTRQPWQVQPVSGWEIQWPSLTYPLTGRTFEPITHGRAVGATYDATTKTLYVLVQLGWNWAQTCIHAYGVNA